MALSEMDVRIQRAAEALKRAGAREVYVFGSTAHGRRREDSDVDLAVSGLPPDRFYEAVGEALAAFKGALDVVDLDDGLAFVERLSKKGGLARVG